MNNAPKRVWFTRAGKDNILLSTERCTPDDVEYIRTDPAAPVRWTNDLTPAQTERLVMLAEEAGEVVQAVGKILRHGYNSRHPDRLHITNREALSHELCDMLAVQSMMLGADDLFAIPLGDITRAVDRKRRYTHHQSEEDDG